MKYYVYYNEEGVIQGISGLKGSLEGKFPYLYVEHQILDDILRKEKRFVDYHIKDEKIQLVFAKTNENMFFKAKEVDKLELDIDISVINDTSFKIITVIINSKLTGAYELYLTEPNNPYSLLRLIGLRHLEKSFNLEVEEVKDYSVYYTDPSITVQYQKI